MNLTPWRNPEFIRHLRGELRWHRAVAVAVVVLIICCLLGLVCWSQQQEMLAAARRGAQEFGGTFSEQPTRLERENVALTLRLFCQWLLILQTGTLTFWSLLSCEQAISGEREGKTWDFQRITRLSPAEMLVGKLLGEPILAYFAVGCSLPLAIFAGTVGGISVGTMAAAYVFLLANALFLGLIGLCVSMVVETRGRGVGLIGALGLYFFVVSSHFLNQSGLPGLSALSPITAMRAVAEQASFFDATMFFGHPFPWLFVSLLLQVSFAVWLVLVLVRNLKREYEQIRPLSRLEAVACAAFLNVVVYALVRPSAYGPLRSSEGLASLTVVINGILLFLIGIAILTPAERLRVWWRTRKSTGSSVFSDNALSWPWLVLCAAAVYVVMAGGLLLWSRALPLNADTVPTAGWRLLVVLSFVIRDVSFIQWCNLTRLRQPVVKGFLYLCLYYVSALILAHVVGYVYPSLPPRVLTVLTPFGVFDSGDRSSANSLYAGLGFQLAGILLQLAAVVLLIRATYSRLRRIPAVESQAEVKA